MMKSLCDICLSVILVSLDKVPDIYKCPTVYKEMLLERLGWHNLLTRYVSSILLTKSLRRIHFYMCHQLDDSLLKSIKDSGCRLRDLTITGCDSVTDIGFQSVTYKQDSLESIKFHYQKHLTNAGLQYVCSPVLVKLDFEGSYKVTFEGVNQLVERNKAIKELHLNRVDDPNMWEPDIRKRIPVDWKQKQTQIIKVAAGLKNNLEEFDCQLNSFDDDGLMTIASYWHNLKRLNLMQNRRVTGQTIKKIALACLNLESCHLPFYSIKLCQTLYSEALLSLPQSIKELSMGYVSLANEECFKRLRNLKTLKLYPRSDDLDDEILIRILEQVGNQLTCLHLRVYQNKITSRALVSVAEHCLNLEVLVLIIYCRTISGRIVDVRLDGLMPIFTDQQRAMKLTTLSLSNKGSGLIQFNELAVVEEVIRSCRNLESLDLRDHAYITDDQLVTLAENCHKLFHVVLRGCEKVTDIGVCALARSCPLERLDIGHIKNITEKSIFTLANTCHYLKDLKIDGNYNMSLKAIRFIEHETAWRAGRKEAVQVHEAKQIVGFKNIQDCSLEANRDMIKFHAATSSQVEELLRRLYAESSPKHADKVNQVI